MTGKYKTIEKGGEGLYKEKGSKFIAKAFHAESEEEIKNILTGLKNEYHDARHHCYAWRLNPLNEKTRSNDDGEPSGSAGKPILNQILSFELFNVFVVVIRYFGGTKLGVSGLFNAYRTAAKEALENSVIIEDEIKELYHIEYEYVTINNVMKVIKQDGVKVLNQNFDNICEMDLEINLSTVQKSTNVLRAIKGLKIKKL